MSRVIKFRAWDNINKRMMHFKAGFGWHDEYNLWHLQYDETKHPHGQGVSDVPFEENINLMQFTGLLDKNKNEIYEGDIVKRIADLFNMDKALQEDSYDHVEQTGIIEYTGHGFWVSTEGFGWEGENLWDWADMEIIGNIYQHPELITAKTLTP